MVREVINEQRIRNGGNAQHATSEPARSSSPIA
jgi:hypothetical protein